MLETVKAGSWPPEMGERKNRARKKWDWGSVGEEGFFLSGGSGVGAWWVVGGSYFILLLLF